jgi:aquaporin Z
MKGKNSGYDVAIQGLGQNGWATFSLGSAMLAEFVGTLIFTLVILAVTGTKGNTPMAGLIIGLTLMVMHFAFIPVSVVGTGAAQPGSLRWRHGTGPGLDVSRVPTIAGRWPAGW